MVSHVLVNEAPLDVDRLVKWKQLLHLSELLESQMELLSTSIHQTEMEHGRYEGTAAVQRVLEEADCKLNLFLLVFIIRLCLLRLDLCLSLIGEALRMVELGIVLLNIDGSLEIGMSLVEILLVELNVSTIEIVVGIILILPDRRFIFIKCAGHIALMVERQAQILMVEG